jgi:hypothetical protein
MHVCFQPRVSMLTYMVNFVIINNDDRDKRVVFQTAFVNCRTNHGQRHRRSFHSSDVVAGRRLESV